MPGSTYSADDAAGLRGLKWLAYTLSPIRISAAWFGEASLSQVQVILFTFIVAGMLFYFWLSSGVLSDISKDLLYLLGISAVGAGGAKFTQTLKTELKPRDGELPHRQGLVRMAAESRCMITQRSGTCS